MTLPIIVCGAAGRMGRTLVELAHQHSDLRVVAAIEAETHPDIGRDAGELAGVGATGIALSADYASVASPDAVTLDFTTPAATMSHLRVAVRHGAPMVIGTTGYSDGERDELDRLAAQIRCVVAPNMSSGITVLLKLVATAAAALGPDFDPEIVEIHHRLKVDAPSGTALALGRAVAAAAGRDLDRAARFGRQGVVGKRSADEIGIMALRGGDAVGDHTVIFAGLGERLELTHRAQSRECLARGALRAALWLIKQPVGRYSMVDVLGL